MTDYKQDIDGDLLFEDGDFVVTESTNQHIEALLYSHKGWWKAHPLCGAGVRRGILDDGNLGELQGIIQDVLETDGLIIKKLTMYPLPPFVNAEYKNKP